MQEYLNPFLGGPKSFYILGKYLYEYKVKAIQVVVSKLKDKSSHKRDLTLNKEEIHKSTK